MSKQIVTIDNKIIDFGEDSFISILNNSVLNLQNGTIYEKASLINNIENFPDDINNLNYEFRFGNFIKQPEKLKIYYTEYKGTGKNIINITCGFNPKFIILSGTYEQRGEAAMTILTHRVNKILTKHSEGVTMTDTGFTFTGTNFIDYCNVPNNFTRIDVPVSGTTSGVNTFYY